MFAYDVMTVSSAWELIPVPMCYSQGDGVNTPRLGLCTVPTSRSVPFLCVVWLSSVARSCATRDKSNKDNVYTPTISAGIICPPSETISHTPRVPNYETGSNTLAARLVICDDYTYIYIYIFISENSAFH